MRTRINTRAYIKKVALLIRKRNQTHTGIRGVFEITN